MKNFILLKSMWVIIFILLISGCQNRLQKKPFPQIIVDIEEIPYEYVSPQNDCHPLWCHGSSILARNNDEVYMSGIETLPQYRPANNIRWMLYKRDSDGWQFQQGDEVGRTREPCPIALLSDGRIMMSANPTLDTAIEKRSTVNQPQILEFSVSNLKGPYKTLMPEWIDNPGFTEHTYRTFSADNENNEFILFNNSRGGNYEEWAFCDRNGKWYPGRLEMKPYVDDPIPVYNEKYMGLSYPSVVLKNKEVHYFGCVALNKWSRIRNLQDAEKVGLKDIIGRGGGAIAGGRFRRVCYLWTPDVTKEVFSDWIEIDNTHENGENIRVTDMWQDPDGTMHLLWHQTPVNLRLRDQFWPDIKRIYAMKYAQVKNGKILLKKSLIESGDSENQEKIEGLEKYSIAWGRFHVTDDNRLFMIFFVSGTTPDGSPRAENRILEVYKDGSVSPSRKIPLKDPMSFFMTATHRGGTLPSKTIDMVGYGVNERLKVHYAKINLQD